MTELSSVKVTAFSRDVERCGPLSPQHVGLDPLYWSDVKLLLIHIRDVVVCSSVRGTFTLYDRPIRRVHVVGVVVAVRVRRLSVEFTLDDSTCTLECAVWSAAARAPNVRLGQTVRAVGPLKSYRTTAQLNADVVAPLNDCHSELVHWAECIRGLAEIHKFVDVRCETAPAVIARKWLFPLIREMIGCVQRSHVSAFTAAALTVEPPVRHTAVALFRDAAADDERIKSAADAAMAEMIRARWIAPFDAAMETAYHRQRLYELCYVESDV